MDEIPIFQGFSLLSLTREEYEAIMAQPGGMEKFMADKVAAMEQRIEEAKKPITITEHNIASYPYRLGQMMIQSMKMNTGAELIVGHDPDKIELPHTDMIGKDTMVFADAGRAWVERYLPGDSQQGYEEMVTDSSITVIEFLLSMHAQQGCRIVLLFKNGASTAFGPFTLEAIPYVSYTEIMGHNVEHVMDHINTAIAKTRGEEPPKQESQFTK